MDGRNVNILFNIVILYLYKKKKKVNLKTNDRIMNNIIGVRFYIIFIFLQIEK